jgi:hypothetical protein
VRQEQCEGRLIFVRCNESANQLCGHPDYIYRVGVAIPLLAPNEHGLPSNDEMELLNYIEDALSEQVGCNQTSLQVLAITTNAMREFVFYTRDPGIVDGAIRNVRSRFPSHEIQSYIAEDGCWELYRHFS